MIWLVPAPAGGWIADLEGVLVKGRGQPPQGARQVPLIADMMPPELRESVGDRLRQAVFQSMRLARKAGQVISGHDTVHAALKAHQVSLVVVADDATDTGKIEAVASHCLGTEMLRFGTKAEWGAVFERELTAHVAVRSEAFAQQIAHKIKQVFGYGQKLC
jgi:ribosomal protein L7Ae-like RNA K-turn-binding protein